MKKFAISCIVMGLLLSGLVLQGSMEVVVAEEPISAGNILYVDRSGGSTYTQISTAVSAASPGDTIYVAPGSYGLISVGGKSDLSIIGNGSQGEVAIYGSAEFIPLYFYQCSNITMSGFYFNGEGTTAALLECQGITFGLNRFQSLGIMSEAISIRDSDEVTIFWSSISSTSRDTFAIELDNSENFFCNSISVNMTGTNAGVIEVVDSDWTTLHSITGTYSGDFIDAQGSNIKTINTVVPDSSVSIDPTSTMVVEFIRRVIVMEEDNISRLQGVEFELKINSITEYSTPYYGGAFFTSTEDGIYEELPNLVQKIFTRNTNPIYFPNTMKFYYSGLDIPTEVDLGEVDAGTTDELIVLFPDMRLPEPPENVTTETVDEDTISVSFDASPSDDVDHYEVWQNVSSDWVEVLNEILPGTFDINYLEPGTFYEFRVRAVDDADLKSSWVYVDNTTEDATMGRINGTAVYIGGPLNGTAAANATLKLGHSSMNGTIDNITDSSGWFDFGIQPFMDDYILVVSPHDYIDPSYNVSGYRNISMTFDHNKLETELELDIPYYEYIPPTAGEINGRVTYRDGPLMGENATNATLYLLNETLVEIENFTVNETGLYHFDEIPFGFNYQMWVVPEDPVGDNITKNGYMWELFPFEFTEATEMDFYLSYHEYVPPNSGDIFGRVIYENGPKDGEGAPDAEVALVNETNDQIDTTYSNGTGHYRFEDVIFGSNYRIIVTPRSEDRPPLIGSSGYPEIQYDPIDHVVGDTEQNIVVEYHEQIVQHPSVTILDDNGDPLPDVVVVVTVDGTKYSAVTDGNGVAEFDDIDRTRFPEGAQFKAIKDGYDDLEWTEGESVPTMVEQNGEKSNNLTLYLIIGLIIIIVIAVLFLLLRKSGVEEEEYREE